MVFSQVEVFCCPFNLLLSHLTPHLLDCSLLLLSNFAQFNPVTFFSPATVNQNSPFWLQYHLLTCRNKARVIAPAVKLYRHASGRTLLIHLPVPDDLRCSCGYSSKQVTLVQYTSASYVSVFYYLWLNFATYCFHTQLRATHQHGWGRMCFLWLTVQNKKSKSVYTTCLLQGMMKNQNVKYSWTLVINELLANSVLQCRYDTGVIDLGRGMFINSFFVVHLKKTKTKLTVLSLQTDHVYF